MQDPDAPPAVVEGETDDGVVVVPEAAAATQLAAINNRGGVIARPWITVTALHGRRQQRCPPGTPAPRLAHAYPQPEPEPLPMREDATPESCLRGRSFLPGQDSGTARKLNVKLEFVKSEADLSDRLKLNGEEKPSLIIFDLNNASVAPYSNPQTEKQTERRLRDRVPVPRAGRLKTESPRSRLRHGPAALRLLPKPPPTPSPPRRRRRLRSGQLTAFN